MGFRASYGGGGPGSSQDDSKRLSLSDSPRAALPSASLPALPSGLCSYLNLNHGGLQPYLPKIRNQLTIIFKQCHATFSKALLISSKVINETIPKEKQTGWLVFRWTLKCVPHLLDPSTDRKMMDYIPTYGLCIDPGVREEAIQVLFRTVRHLPHSRFAVMRGMANFILRIPDDLVMLINVSLSRLVQLMNEWRICLAQETAMQEMASDSSPWSASSGGGGGGGAGAAAAVQSYSLALDREMCGPPVNGYEEGGGLFDPSGIDAVGLIFLCSKDVQIRRIAIELLSSVRALQYDLSVALGHVRTSPESGQTFVIDVFEEAGEDIVQRCYWDIGRWSELRREHEPIPGNVNLMSVLEDVDRLRWARCLNELVKCVAELCPDTVQGARFEVQARLSAMVHAQDGSSRLGQGADSDKLDQWHIYCMFAWGCPMEDGRDLLRLTLSTVKTGADIFLQYSAAVALGRTHHNMYESMLTEVNTYVEEVSKEAADRPKWKSQKLRREDWKSFVAQVYRMASESIWPGMLGKKRVLRTLFLKFIHDCVRYISTSTVDMFYDVQAVRYALASVLRALSVDLSKYLPDKFDTVLRKQLFELMWSWCDDANHDHGGSEYRKELERYKAAQAMRLKDQGERHAIERELNDQVECIHWAALHAMAALLAGPCFDDGARKMSGKVMGWINGLFMGTTERVPIGFPPPDAHMPSPHARGGLSGNLEHSHRSLMGRETKRPGPVRLLLAKTALLNLLLTNSDLFNPCINQCYSSDPSIADGYFSVLAEVYMRQDVPDSEIAVILSLILYKVVDPSKQIRDDALQMLEALSERKWSSEGESGCGSDRYRAAVVGSLPDSYQQFQYQLSATLAREHQELSVFLCEEIMQRQLDAVDIIAQHQVLTCMAPWIENLNFVALWSSGWSERLLKSLYYVTWKHGDQFPDEIEKQWSTVAAKWRNIIPVLDFLITKGINEFDSNALGEINGGAFSTYLSIAKRICLYLARISPQQTIDHLMYQVANRKLEDRPDIVTRRSFEVEEEDPILFSQGHPQMDFPSLPQSSPMYRGGSFDGISRTSGLGGNNWRTSASRGFSGLLNGGMASVRSSSGSLRAHHISRDSGDLNMDTPRSTDDLQGVGTPMGSQTGYIGMTGPLHAGFPDQHHWLSRADIALILLTEIAYENDEDFRGHLPLLFHVMFVLMDSSEDIVLEHCQQLLVNLLYSLAGRHLELYDAAASVEHGDGEYKHQVVSLIKYLQSRKGTMMWENEDMTLPRLTLTSATLLGSLVSSVVDAIFFQGDLRERWGDEALRWAMECTSRHLACRSHQIYRALHPPVTSDTCVLLLRCVHRCLQNPTPPILGFVVETLLTLQVVVEAMEPEKVILYPQMFWGCVAMLHTDYVDVYTQVLELFARVIDRLAFNDYTAENVLLSNVPKEYVSPDQDRGRSEVDHRIRTMMGDVMPAKRVAEEANEGERVTDDEGTAHHALGLRYVAFEGVQALVLKGLLSTSSHWAAVEVLSRIALLSCDKIFGSSETRLLMHMVGLLPWLCVQLQSPTLILTRSCSSSSSISTAAAGTAGWGGSYQQLRIRQQQSKARSVAGNISQICADRSLEDLAITFAMYADGAIGSVEEMLDRVAPAICKEWFPQQASLAFSYLMRLLEKGPTEFREIALLMIHALLVNSEGDVVMGPQLAISVAQLVQGPLCREAVLVLDALLDCRAVHGLADSNREDKGARTQRVGRSNGVLGGGSGWMGWAAAGEVEEEAPETANDPGAEFRNEISFLSLPSREESQEQVLLMLGKVLETYGPGKKRDNRRLVPFAAPTFGGPLGREESKKGKSENVEDEH